MTTRFAFDVRDAQSRRRRNLRKRAWTVHQLEERCLLSSGSISGNVMDGTRALAGVTVYLDQNRNERLDSGESATITDSSGAYVFPGLDPGTYAVEQTPPNGFIQTSPAPLRGEALPGEIIGEQAAPGPNPASVAWVDGQLYIAQRYDSRVDVVDPNTGTVTRSFSTPVHFFDITYDGTSLWGVDDVNQQVVEFDKNGLVIKQFSSPGSLPRGIAWDGQALWVLDYTSHNIDRIDPANGTVLSSITAPVDQPVSLDYDDAHLWLNGIAAWNTFALDPATGAVAMSFATPVDLGPGTGSGANRPLGLAFDGTKLWIVQSDESRIYQVGLRSPSPQVLELTATSPTASGIDFTDFQLGTISGTIFDDQNDNGSLDADEPRLEGWKAYLDTNGNGQFDDWEPTALTNSSGSYTFTMLRDGSYRVGVVERAPGWVLSTSPGLYSTTISSSGQEILGNDFGQHLQDVGPVGAEFRVNTTTAGQQGFFNSVSGEGQVNSVATDAQGNFVVVWEGGGPGDSVGVFAQLYRADGTPRGGEFRVNDVTVDNQRGPVVAMDNAGNFAVAWSTQSASDPTANHAVFARVFNADGSPRTGDLTVVPFSTRETALATSIAMNADGDFAVLTYGSTGSFGSMHYNGGLIYFQRDNALGQAQGKRVQVADTSLINGSASIAMDAVGNMVVAWGETDNLVIHAQRFNSSGQKAGTEVVTGLTDGYYRPSVAMADNGHFAITANGTFRVFDPSGAPLSGVVSFRPSSGAGVRDSITIDAGGDVIVAWGTNAGSGSAAGEVLAQRFLPTGTPREPAFLVNTTIELGQRTPSVSADGRGGFVVAWNGNGPGDDAGVFAQRYVPPGPPPGSPTTFSINDVTQAEGDSGTTIFTFTVTRLGDNSNTSTVYFATADGTATSGSDYLATSGTLSFDPGVTTQTITVQVVGDTVVEPDETLYINLSNASGAEIARSQGVGQILNDDTRSGGGGHGGPNHLLAAQTLSTTEQDLGTPTFTDSYTDENRNLVTMTSAPVEPGSYTVTATLAGDSNDNDASATASLMIAFEARSLTDLGKAFKSGRTSPIKLQLTGASLARTSST